MVDIIIVIEIAPAMIIFDRLLSAEAIQIVRRLEFINLIKTEYSFSVLPC
jgi:hypothetical protein